MAVLKACGLKMEFDEVYGDYQRIYDKTMEMQDEKMNERGESGRSRARQSALSIYIAFFMVNAGLHPDKNFV